MTFTIDANSAGSFSIFPVIVEVNSTHGRIAARLVWMLDLSQLLVGSVDILDWLNFNVIFAVGFCFIFMDSHVLWRDGGYANRLTNLPHFTNWRVGYFFTHNRQIVDLVDEHLGERWLKTGLRSKISALRWILSWTSCSSHCFLHKLGLVPTNTLFKHLNCLQICYKGILGFLVSKFELVNGMLLPINDFFALFNHAHCFVSFLSKRTNVALHLLALTLPYNKLSPKSIFHPTLAVNHFRLLLLAVAEFLYKPVSMPNKVLYLCFEICNNSFSLSRMPRSLFAFPHDSFILFSQRYHLSAHQIVVRPKLDQFYGVSLNNLLSRISLFTECSWLKFSS